MKLRNLRLFKVADILLAAELENEMAEMAGGEEEEQDYEDEVVDVSFPTSLITMIRGRPNIM